MKDKIIRNWALAEIWWDNIYISRIKVSRKSVVIITSIIIVLLATNPNQTAFKNYLPIAVGLPDGLIEKAEIIYGREFNCIIFSVYKVKWRDQNVIFIGVLSNFFRI